MRDVELCGSFEEHEKFIVKVWELECRAQAPFMPFCHVSVFSRPEFAWCSRSCQRAKTSDHRELFIHASLLFCRLFWRLQLTHFMLPEVRTRWQRDPHQTSQSFRLTFSIFFLLFFLIINLMRSRQKGLNHQDRVLKHDSRFNNSSNVPAALFPTAAARFSEAPNSAGLSGVGTIC